jgi:hypothetical protein
MEETGSQKHKPATLFLKNLAAKPNRPAASKKKALDIIF